MENHSLRIGLSFGMTSGIITTLGLMVGLHSGTHLKIAVIGGILTIAVADAFSDALGIHMSEESERKHTDREIWQSTISTFFFKFLFALSFLIPVLLLELQTAIIVAVIWGLSALSILSLHISSGQGSRRWRVMFEHLTIALIVIVIAHYIGEWLSLSLKV
ncbi:VIT1/CCC1 transporter family protein [[Eubacterium] cellulosolvens]